MHAVGVGVVLAHSLASPAALAAAAMAVALDAGAKGGEEADGPSPLPHSADRFFVLLRRSASCNRRADAVHASVLSPALPSVQEVLALPKLARRGRRAFAAAPAADEGLGSVVWCVGDSSSEDEVERRLWVDFGDTLNPHDAVESSSIGGGSGGRRVCVSEAVVTDAFVSLNAAAVVDRRRPRTNERRFVALVGGAEVGEGEEVQMMLRFAPPLVAASALSAALAFW